MATDWDKVFAEDKPPKTDWESVFTDSDTATAVAELPAPVAEPPKKPVWSEHGKLDPKTGKWRFVPPPVLTTGSPERMQQLDQSKEEGKQFALENWQTIPEGQVAVDTLRGAILRAADTSADAYDDQLFFLQEREFFKGQVFANPMVAQLSKEQQLEMELNIDDQFRIASHITKKNAKAMFDIRRQKGQIALAKELAGIASGEVPWQGTEQQFQARLGAITPEMFAVFQAELASKDPKVRDFWSSMGERFSRGVIGMQKTINKIVAMRKSELADTDYWERLGKPFFQCNGE